MSLGCAIALRADGRWCHRDCCAAGQVAATAVVTAQPMINMV